MSPFFSIIIPTYNRAGFITIAIDSVVQQTFVNWELIIVDDGSTDNTKEIVAAYKDSRIKYIYQKNAERSEARNNGIKNSHGAYICFLDSDDYYLSDRLSKLYSEIIKQGELVALYYTGIAYKNQSLITERPGVQNNLENVYDFIVQTIIGTPQVCIHYSILKKIYFNPEITIGEDMELWLRIATDFPLIYLEHQITVVALQHHERSVNVKFYNSYSYQIKMLKKIFLPTHPGYKISKPIKQTLVGNAYFGIAKYYIYAGSKWCAIKNLFLAVAVDIRSKQNKYRLNIILHLLFFPNRVESLLR